MRTMCDILDDLRKADGTKNYSYLSGLIEEIQWAANRMESAIYDSKDIERYTEARSKARDLDKEIRKAHKHLVQLVDEGYDKFDPKVLEAIKKYEEVVKKDIPYHWSIA